MWYGISRDFGVMLPEGDRFSCGARLGSGEGYYGDEEREVKRERGGGGLR